MLARVYKGLRFVLADLSAVIDKKATLANVGFFRFNGLAEAFVHDEP
jgi:hypothetical protein